jgi:transketolase
VRGIIIDALRQRMAEDKSLFFLTGDMGINLVEPIQQAFPDRFLNVGIAEQSLIGTAAGLCNAGFRPVAYTIGNFLVHRCLEQIRDDVVLHGYPVTLLGTSTGFDNAPLGPTHHMMDDWGALRALPGIDVYAPSSVEFASTALDVALEAGRPAYIRVAKGKPSIPAASGVSGYLPGKDSGTLLVTYGPLAGECIKAQFKRPELSVLVLNRIHPLDGPALAPFLAAHPGVLVVEDHFGQCGLYASLCQLAMEQHLRVAISSLAPSEYTLIVAQSAEAYYRRLGLDAAGILRRVEAREERVGKLRIGQPA